MKISASLGVMARLVACTSRGSQVKVTSHLNGEIAYSTDLVPESSCTASSTSTIAGWPQQTQHPRGFPESPRGLRGPLAMSTAAGSPCRVTTTRSCVVTTSSTMPDRSCRTRAGAMFSAMLVGMCTTSPLRDRGNRLVPTVLGPARCVKPRDIRRSFDTDAESAKMGRS